MAGLATLVGMRRWSGAQRAGLSVMAIALTASVSLVTFVGVGDAETTAQRLERAKREYRSLQTEADELARRFGQGETEADLLAESIVVTKRKVAENDVEFVKVRGEVVRLARSLYMRGSVGGAYDLAPLASLMDSARISVYSATVAERDRQTLENFRSARDRLIAEQGRLVSEQRRQKAVALSIKTASAEINRKLRALSDLQKELGAKVVAEEAVARRAAEAERRRQEAARQDATTTTRPDASPGTSPKPRRVAPPSTTPTTQPGRSSGGSGGGAGGSYGVNVCPIQGPLSFIDSWGDPRPGGRHHEGVDLINSMGTPNVAVTSGTLEYRSGNLMGNGIFLYGDNGNTYYYFHLSRYAGPARHVSQGEVIAYTGSTGASGTPHTHFEIHPVGGGPVNPYSAARAVC